ncbi:MAG TPA: hypothetical protein VJY33_21315, partial [Isosphaeraceae bacterium]|nr:hypothetical protein [Isosphaeraceae bacterium]
MGALKSAAAWVARLQPVGESAPALAELIERVEVSREGVRLSLKLPLPPINADGGGGVDQVALNKFVSMQMKRRGVEMRLVLEGETTPSHVNLPL